MFENIKKETKQILLFFGGMLGGMIYAHAWTSDGWKNGIQLWHIREMDMFLIGAFLIAITTFFFIKSIIPEKEKRVES